MSDTKKKPLTAKAIQKIEANIALVEKRLKEEIEKAKGKKSPGGDKITKAEQELIGGIQAKLGKAKAKLKLAKKQKDAPVTKYPLDVKLVTPYGLSLGTDGINSSVSKTHTLASGRKNLPIPTPIPILDFGLFAETALKLDFRAQCQLKEGELYVKAGFGIEASGRIGGYITDKLHLIRLSSGLSLTAGYYKDVKLSTKSGLVLTPFKVGVKAIVDIKIDEGDTIFLWNKHAPAELKIPFPNWQLKLGELELLYFKIELSAEALEKTKVLDWGIGKDVAKMTSYIENKFLELKKDYDQKVNKLADVAVQHAYLYDAVVALWDGITASKDYIGKKWQELTDSKYDAKKKMYEEACYAYFRDLMQKNAKVAVAYASKDANQRKEYFKKTMKGVPLAEKLHRELFAESASGQIAGSALNTANALTAKYDIKIEVTAKEIVLGKPFQFQVIYTSDRKFKADKIDVNLRCMTVDVPNLRFSPVAASPEEDLTIDVGTYRETVTANLSLEFIEKVAKQHKCDITKLQFYATVKVDLAGISKDVFKYIKLPIANYSASE
ncbi:MAG: hypothetical protein GY810_14120 [Aureispira sp.]|nr:hypothetical protein [Aureispira sp.]